MTQAHRSQRSSTATYAFSPPKATVTQRDPGKTPNQWERRVRRVLSECSPVGWYRQPVLVEALTTVPVFDLAWKFLRWLAPGMDHAINPQHEQVGPTWSLRARTISVPYTEDRLEQEQLPIGLAADIIIWIDPRNAPISLASELARFDEVQIGMILRDRVKQWLRELGRRCTLAAICRSGFHEDLGSQLARSIRKFIEQIWGMKVLVGMHQAHLELDHTTARLMHQITHEQLEVTTRQMQGMAAIGLQKEITADPRLMQMVVELARFYAPNATNLNINIPASIAELIQKQTNVANNLQTAPTLNGTLNSRRN